MTQSTGEWRNGTVPLLGGGIANATGAAFYSYAAGFLVIPLTEAMGWTRADIAFGQTLVLLTIALTMPITGALIDRFGTRTIGSIGILAYGLAALGIAAATMTLPVYYAALFGFALAGSLTSGVVWAPVVVRFFSRWRGVALGLLFSGPATLLLVLSPTVQHFIAQDGWRAGYVIIGVLALVIGLPSVLLLIPRHVTKAQAASAPVNPGVSFSQAWRSADYWKILIGTNAAAIAIGGLLNQLPAMLTDAGFGGAVAGLMSAFAIMVIIGRTTVGLLFDHFLPTAVTFIVMVCAAAAAWLLILPDPSIVLLTIAVCVAGIAMGAESDMPAFFCGRQFGLRAFATIYGTFGMSAVAGMGIGAAMFGALFEQNQNYAIAIGATSALFVIAGLIFASVGKPFQALAPDAAEPAVL